MKIDIKGVVVDNDDGWIYDLLEFDHTTPRQVSEALGAANNEPIDVYINSPGGSVAAGVEIYSMLLTRNNVSIHVCGRACSVASVIMCAGRSDITPAGMVMIHNVSMRAEGDKTDMKHAAEILDTADRAIAAAYCKKTGRAEDEILQMMSKETWLTANEAVELGFADSITAGAAPFALAASASGMLPEKLIGELKNKNARARAELELLKLKAVY